LVHAGDLLADETAGMPGRSSPGGLRDRAGWKMPRLEQAARRFLQTASAERRRGFDAFCQRHASWLDDYVLFMAIKEEFDRRAAAERFWGASWNAYWDKDIARREPPAIERWRRNLSDRLLVHRVWQYYFFEQWTALRRT
jgi:4-alpha-glucanotransferase